MDLISSLGSTVMGQIASPLIEAFGHKLDARALLRLLYLECKHNEGILEPFKLSGYGDSPAGVAIANHIGARLQCNYAQSVFMHGSQNRAFLSRLTTETDFIPEKEGNGTVAEGRSLIALIAGVQVRIRVLQDLSAIATTSHGRRELASVRWFIRLRNIRNATATIREGLCGFPEILKIVGRKA